MRADPRRRPKLTWRRVSIPVLLVASLAALATAVGTLSRPPPSPFDGVRLYTDPAGPAALAARDVARSDPRRSRVLRRVAAKSHAVWLGDWVGADAISARVRAHVEAARRTREVALFVLYNLPHRDCVGRHSAGGARDAATYRSWVRAFATGLGRAKAFVVIEPDAVAQLDCLSPAQRAERLELLRVATGALAVRPGVASYLDAGHGGWTAPAEMARRLRAAGIGDVRGFAVNVAFYDDTAAEIAYATRVSDLVEHKPFVIDTSRNGRGRAAGSDSWCNPAGRALGHDPLSAAGDERVDALLWIKTPGISDGDCGRGEPPAGAFWSTRAAQLAVAAGM